jgi:hypothetical protein
MKENMAVAIYNRIIFPVLEIRHQLDPFTSMHRFIICVVSLLLFINSLLRSKKQEKSSPKQENYFFTRKTKKILRWRTASTSIQYGQNNDQTTASTWFSSVRTGSQNRTEIGVDRALMLTGTTDPGAGLEVQTNFLKTEKDSGYDGNSPAPRPGERDNPFSCTPSFVSLPVLEQIFFYDQISQIYKFTSKSDL